MDPEQREKFVNRPMTAVFATVTASGHPHAVPVWYRYVDGRFHIITARGSAKHRNVERTGRAALAIDDREGAFAHVTASGTVEVIDPCTYDERLALHTVYRGARTAKEVVDRGGHEGMVVLVLTPDRWY
jgi:PPOX class probable F420-dependent enzyme